MRGRVLDKGWVTGLVCFALVAASCGGGASTQGGKAPPVTVRFTHHFPTVEPAAKAVARYAQLVHQSDGTVTVQVYPNGQLFSQDQAVQAVAAGSVDVALNSESQFEQLVPVLDVLGAPYVVENWNQVEATVSDAKVNSFLDSQFQKKGLKYFGMIPYGWTDIINKARAARQPNDLHGLKIRSYGKTPSDTISAFGASPVLMSTGDIYQGIQLGTVDGAISGVQSFHALKLTDVAKYVTEAHINFGWLVVAMNLAKYRSLPAQQQNALTRALPRVLSQDEQQTMGAVAEARKGYAGQRVSDVQVSDFKPWEQATASVRNGVVTRNADNKQLYALVQAAAKRSTASPG